MDPSSLLPFQTQSDDPLERDLLEIDAAIGLVSKGQATRVRLVSLSRPEAASPTGLARAQAAGVRFSLDRGAAAIASVTVGPRIRRRDV
jgi:hypothetical protein